MRQMTSFVFWSRTGNPEISVFTHTSYYKELTLKDKLRLLDK